MRIAYQYRLKPTPEQKAVINKWLDMLRYQYNYLLADRFDWYQNNKSFADAGLSQFVEILTSKAEKAGLLVVKVDPRGTSQHCCKCFNRVPEELNDRWHLCPNCGLSLDRDLNSAILIQKVGLDTALLKNAQSSKLKKEKPTL